MMDTTMSKTDNSRNTDVTKKDSNFVQDIATAFANIPTVLPDLLSLPEGVLRGAYNLAFTEKEDPFSRGFEESSFGKISDAWREGTEDLIGGDPESKTYQAAEALGYFVPGLLMGKSGQATKLAINAYNKKSKLQAAAKLAEGTAKDKLLSAAKTNANRLKKHATQAFMMEAVPQAAIQGVMSVATDTPFGNNIVDQAINYGAVAGMLSKGYKHLRTGKRLEGLNLLKQNREQLKNTAKMKANEWATNYVDARGGTLDKLASEGLMKEGDRLYETLSIPEAKAIETNRINKRFNDFVNNISPENRKFFGDIDAMENELNVRERYRIENAIKGITINSDEVGFLDPDTGKLMQTEKLMSKLDDTYKLLGNGSVTQGKAVYNKYRTQYKNFAMQDLDNLYKAGIIDKASYIRMGGADYQAWLSARRFDETPDNIDLLTRLYELETDYRASGERSISNAVEKGAGISHLMHRNLDTSRGVLNPVDSLDQLGKNLRESLLAIEHNKRVRLFMDQFIRKAPNVIKNMAREIDDLAGKLPSASKANYKRYLQRIRYLSSKIDEYKSLSIPDLAEIYRSKESWTNSLEAYKKALSSAEKTIQKNSKTVPLKTYKDTVESSRGLFQTATKYIKSIDRKSPSGTETLKVYSDGKEYSFGLPKDFLNILQDAEINNDPLLRWIKTLNGIADSFTVGAFNPTFLPRALMYNLGEVVPTVLKETKHTTNPVGLLQTLKLEAKNFKESMRRSLNDYLIQGIKEHGTFWGRTSDDIAELQADIDRYISRKAKLHPSNVDQLGTHMASYGLCVVPVNATQTEEYLAKMKTAWGDFNNTGFVRIFRALSEGVREAGEGTLMDVAEMSSSPNKMIKALSKNTSDTSRRGAGGTTLSDLVNVVRDHTRYGAASVHGLFGKLNLFSTTENMYEVLEELKYLRDLDLGKINYAFDAFAVIADKLGEMSLSDSAMIMYKTVVAPTALCYLWNHMTPEQTEEFNQIADFEKSNSYMMLNALGKGVHLTIPCDQEWSIVSNVTEAMLDHIFGLSDFDASDPNAGYYGEISQSLARGLGVELPAPVEAMFNAMGYETNFNVGAAVSDEINAIEPLRERKTDNISAEANGILRTMAGRLGALVGNVANGRDSDVTRLGFFSIGAYKDMKSDTAKEIDEYFAETNDPAIASLMKSRRKLEHALRKIQSSGMNVDGTVHEDYNALVEQYRDAIGSINGQMYQIINA